MSPKRALRRITRDRRDALCDDERQCKALAIKEIFFAQPEFKKAKVILFYAAFGSEVPTLDMMEDALRLGKEVILPITDVETNALVLRQVFDLEGLQPSKYGIPEPVIEKTAHCEASRIDLVLVPGMVFDEAGNRIGYGGGYYDRFLRQLDPSVSWVSVAFELQIAPLIPKESHDLPVDKIITEQRVIDTHEGRLRERNPSGDNL